MLPYYDYQAINCVPEEKVPDEHANIVRAPKLRHRLCRRVGTLMIAIGERLTAVYPPEPTATDLELA